MSTIPPRRWRKVSDKELRNVRRHLTRKDGVWGGNVTIELCRRYGRSNIKHTHGGAWYKLTNR